jgi:hypothetical protein
MPIQRNSVSGLTSRLVRSGPGEGPARAVSTARSAQSSFGLVFCRHGTATSWHSTSNSASLDAAGRAGNAIQSARRTNIKYSIRTTTSPQCCQPYDHCRSQTRTHRGLSCQVGVLD